MLVLYLSKVSLNVLMFNSVSLLVCVYFILLCGVAFIGTSEVNSLFHYDSYLAAGFKCLFCLYVQQMMPIRRMVLLNKVQVETMQR